MQQLKTQQGKLTPAPPVKPEERAPHSVRSFRRLDCMLLGGLMVVASFLCCYRIGESELFINNDETRHAFTGVFIRDLIVDFPAASPLGYAREYYERYPAVGVFRWPPFFHAVEALFFMLLGISVPAAKLSVAAFALVFVIFFYRIVREDFGAGTAAGATLLAITAPQVIFYGRAVMLEIPTLALCVAALCYFRRALRGESAGARYLCVLFTALALLTKQNALFLLPMFGVYALLSGGIKRIVGRAWALPFVLLAVLTVPYYIAAMSVYGGTLLRDASGGNWSHLGDPHHWLWYYYTLPKQLGSMTGHASALPQAIAHLALFSTLGVAVYAVARRRREPYLFYVCWIVVCYLFFAPMSQTDSRHMILWIPPLCLMTTLAVRAAGIWLSKATRRRKSGAAFAAAAVLAICLYTGLDTMTHRPYVRGYEASAKFIAENQKEGSVFFKGYLNGNFIFFLRSADPSRRVGVRRASRDLFSTETMSKYGLEEHIKSEDALLALLRKHDVRRLVIEEPDIFDDADKIESLAILREALQTPRFRPEREFPVDSNVPRYRGVALKVFRFEEED